MKKLMKNMSKHDFVLMTIMKNHWYLRFGQIINFLDKNLSIDVINDLLLKLRAQISVNVGH